MELGFDVIGDWKIFAVGYIGGVRLAGGVFVGRGWV